MYEAKINNIQCVKQIVLLRQAFHFVLSDFLGEALEKIQTLAFTTSRDLLSDPELV